MRKRYYFDERTLCRLGESPFLISAGSALSTPHPSPRHPAAGDLSLQKMDEGADFSLRSCPAECPDHGTAAERIIPTALRFDRCEPNLGVRCEISGHLRDPTRFAAAGFLRQAPLNSVVESTRFTYVRSGSRSAAASRPSAPRSSSSVLPSRASSVRVNSLSFGLPYTHMADQLNKGGVRKAAVQVQCANSKEPHQKWECQRHRRVSACVEEVG
jgi:hypothetical protein